MQYLTEDAADDHTDNRQKNIFPVNVGINLTIVETENL